jgi:hypothetical protein
MTEDKTMTFSSAQGDNPGSMITYSGLLFNPTKPNLDGISIQDIAHALSNMCRFGGHSRTFL